jgi:hypothetical protein
VKLPAKVLAAGLTPPQLALVTLVFVFTLVGALGLAFALRRWNRRHPILNSISRR